jgi:SPP1 gp7 family putative phage head morphogenesis protein
VITADLLLRYKVPKRSRTAARRNAPQPPTAPGLLYLRDLKRLRREWKAHVLQDMTLMPPSLVRKIAQLKVEALELFTSERVTAFLRGVGIRTAAHARKEVSRVIGVPLKDVIDEGRLASFQRENVELITHMSTAELDDIGETISAAQFQGLRVEDLAKQIEARQGVSDSRAALIARDQTLKLNSDIAQSRMQSVGVTQYVWVTSRDERVRGNPNGKWANADSDHWSLDGKTFSFNDPPVTNQKTGARNPPGKDYQCRCTASPVIDDLF